MLFAGEPVLYEECAEMRHGVDSVRESDIAVSDFYAKGDVGIVVGVDQRSEGFGASVRPAQVFLHFVVELCPVKDVFSGSTAGNDLNCVV